MFTTLEADSLPLGRGNGEYLGKQGNTRTCPQVRTVNSNNDNQKQQKPSQTDTINELKKLIKKQASEQTNKRHCKTEGLGSKRSPNQAEAPLAYSPVPQKKTKQTKTKTNKKRYNLSLYTPIQPPPPPLPAQPYNFECLRYFCENSEHEIWTCQPIN